MAAMTSASDQPYPAVEKPNFPAIESKILDRWEELREDKLSDLSAEEIVDQDEDLQRLVADRSHVLSEANEKINKLRRFDSKLGIAKEAQEPRRRGPVW